MAGKINAHPAKRFFVEMLTRDIELKDSILDLLDNCVDGAMREKKDELASDQPYVGFKAEITFGKDFFRLLTIVVVYRRASLSRELFAWVAPIETLIVMSPLLVFTALG